MDSIERFWSKVDKSGGPDACWLWIGGTNEAGYGQFWAHRSNAEPGERQRRFPAHRWLLGYLRGNDLIGGASGIEDACHRCDNPPCVNPAHLYVGTRKQNIGEAVERSRMWQTQVTHCPAGHAYEGDNLSIKRTGARRCNACTRQDNARRRRLRSECKNGHPLEGDNLLLCKNGARKCRICDAARIAKIAASRS